MMNPYTDAVKSVLKWVVTHKKFFEKNPKPLAYLMGFHDEMHYASRYDEDKELHDWENPKYAICDLEEIVGSDYANLVYDAWAYNIDSRENDQFGKPLPLESKINKTMDDWMKISLNPKYRFHELYPNKKRVYDRFLCVNGPGVSWNKDGYLSHIGPSGVDLDIFAGAINSFKTLPKEIQRKIVEFRNDPVVKKGLKKKKLMENERRKEELAVKMLANGSFLLKLKKDLKKTNDKKRKDEIRSVINAITDTEKKHKKTQKDDLANGPFYPMSKGYCNLDSMPKNSHPSYVKAGIELCHMILENTEESKNRDNVLLANEFLQKWENKSRKR